MKVLLLAGLMAIVFAASVHAQAVAPAEDIASAIEATGAMVPNCDLEVLKVSDRKGRQLAHDAG